MQKLIVIPARGGSKGIPLKNIYPVAGEPLLSYTLEVIREAELQDTDIVVSTDSEKIKEVAQGYNDIHIADRPEEISGDTASTELALVHALDFMERLKVKKYDAVITLQATSPLREAQTLKNFVLSYEKDYPEYNAQLSLNENRSDFWIKKENHIFERLYKNAPRRRQDRKPLYVENSAYYITDANILRKTNSILGTKAKGFIISEYEAIDINEKIDIYLAENIIRNRCLIKEHGE